MIRVTYATRGLLPHVMFILLVVGIAVAETQHGVSRRPPTDEQFRETMKIMEEGARIVEARTGRERYAEKAAEIALRTDDVAASSRENAAFLYYQALLARREMDPCTAEIYHAVLGGAEPDQQLRAYLGYSLKTIELVQIASQMPKCNWGLACAGQQGLDANLAKHLRQLCFLLHVDARTLAADGHCRAALARCLTIRRLAHHTGDDTYLIYAVSQGINGMALRTIQRVLNTIKPDRETFTWLREQLATVQGTPFRPAQALKKWRDADLEFWHTRPQGRPFTRDLIAERIKDENEETVQEIMAHTDEELLVMLLTEQLMFSGPPSRNEVAAPPELIERARQDSDRFLGSASQIMEADMSYSEKQTKLTEMVNSLDSQASAGNPIVLLPSAPRAVAAYHRLMVRNLAYLNVLRAATEISLAKADTGQLPETLPPGLPKDPLSGKDFGYERTERGFVLRLDPDNLSQSKIREFQFLAYDAGTPIPGVP